MRVENEKGNPKIESEKGYRQYGGSLEKQIVFGERLF